MNEHFTCVDFSLETLSAFIFARGTPYSCSIRLKGSIRETHLVFTFFNSFSNFNKFQMPLRRMVEVSMGALQQTLNAVS
jgi:hypothetical protein